MKRYAYTCVFLGANDVSAEEVLNALGQQGWRLVVMDERLGGYWGWLERESSGGEYEALRARGPG